MRAWLSLAVLVILVSSASAQAPSQAYPAPNGYYPPQPAPPPMQAQLTLDEQFLLERGYISDGEHIGGGLAAWFIGFGVGQAIQGRWSQRGYIFTIGEPIAFGVVIYGALEMMSCVDNGDGFCNNNRGVGLFLGGALALGGLRIWEIVDAFIVPPSHNRKLTQLRMRLGMPIPMYTRITPYAAPGRDGGGVAGVTLRF